MLLINIGYGNMLSATRVITIVAPEASPVKRIVQSARERHMLIDATCGRKTKSVIVMDSGHIVLSAISAETLAHRISGTDSGEEEEENEK